MNLNLGFCPSCHADLRGLTIDDYGEQPEDGDLAVCCDCGAVLEMVDGKFAGVTVDELKLRGEEQSVILALHLAQIAVKRRNRARAAREN